MVSKRGVMNDKILTAKQARMLTENRDRTILLLAEAIAEAALAGQYSIRMDYNGERNELQKLYWENHEYFSSYLKGIGYDVAWKYMTFDEISWGEKKGGVMKTEDDIIDEIDIRIKAYQKELISLSPPRVSNDRNEVQKSHDQYRINLLVGKIQELFNLSSWIYENRN